jgi:hypothetical protein
MITSHIITSHFARELSFSEPNVLGFGIAQNECQSFVHDRDIHCRKVGAWDRPAIERMALIANMCDYTG